MKYKKRQSPWTLDVKIAVHQIKQRFLGVESSSVNAWH